MSTKELGCFFCEGIADRGASDCPKCGRSLFEDLPFEDTKIGQFRVSRALGRGHYGVTVLGEDEFSQKRALKLIPDHRQSVTDSFQEPQALVQCSPHPNLAGFVARLVEDVELLGCIVKCSVLVFEYIDNSVSLGEFLESADDLSRADVRDILGGICHGLARMKRKGLWHNDLHDDNVLIRRVDSDEGLASRFQAKIIDFGSADDLDKGLGQFQRADCFYLGKHTYGMTAAFERCRQSRMSQHDRSFANQLHRIADRFMDQDPTRREEDPRTVFERIKEASLRSDGQALRPSFEDMRSKGSINLARPLDNSNALTLHPHDISRLYRDDLDWSQSITKSETVIIVGPRGCGKTMLLRHQSLVIQAWPRLDETSIELTRARLDDMKFVGFLIGCSDLRTPFLRSSFKKLAEKPRLAEDFTREYLNIAFSLEVLRNLLWLQTEQLAVIGRDELLALAQELCGLLPEGGLITNAEDAIEKLERRHVLLSNLGDPKSYQPSNYCRIDVLSLITSRLRVISWAAEKEIQFLLDDYSPSLLPEIAIYAYNPVIFRLSERERIKVSSEGEGPALSDSLGRRYREGREFTKVSLGEVYFTASENQGRLFIENILRRRCQETGYGSVEKIQEILGEHEADSSFGDYIRNLPRAGNAKFYGFGLICRLCSGDLSYVLELLRSILGSNWADSGSMRNSQQHDIVQRFARRQLMDLRGTPGSGDFLFEFASRLGSLLRRYLLNSNKRADERLRIEVEGTEELSDRALKRHRALLQHSVLVDGGVGKSRAGEPTKKFFFRRLYAPVFPFSPQRRGCIALSVSKYEQWLLDPIRIADLPVEEEDPWLAGLGGLKREREHEIS